MTSLFYFYHRNIIRLNFNSPYAALNIIHVIWIWSSLLTVCPPRFPHYPAICSQTPFKASDNPHVFIDVFKTKRICFFFSNIMSCLILFPLNKQYFILILNTWCQKSVNGKCQFIFTDRTRPANIYLYTDWITSDLTFSLPHKYIDFHRVKRIRFYQNPFMLR